VEMSASLRLAFSRPRCPPTFPRTTMPGDIGNVPARLTAKRGSGGSGVNRGGDPSSCSDSAAIDSRPLHLPSSRVVLPLPLSHRY
jgi:hypothetical protein